MPIPVAEPETVTMVGIVAVLSLVTMRLGRGMRREGGGRVWDIAHETQTLATRSRDQQASRCDFAPRTGVSGQESMRWHSGQRKEAT
eukprot:3699935-Rhodomonas_salina.2